MHPWGRLLRVCCREPIGQLITERRDTRIDAWKRILRDRRAMHIGNNRWIEGRIQELEDAAEATGWIRHQILITH